MSPTAEQPYTYEEAPKWPLFGLLIWFILLGFTDRGGGDDVSSIEGRISMPDMYFALLGPILCYLAWKRGGITLPRFGVAAVAFLGWAAIFTPFSTNVWQSFFEILVHCFAFFGFLATFAYLRTCNWDYRLRAGEAWLWGTGVIAFLGVFDFFLFSLGKGSIFPDNNRGAVIGTFRNTGQAGAFYMVASTLAVPFYRIMRPKFKFLGAICVILILLAGILTVKRSTLFGLGFGLVLLPFFEPTRAGTFRTITLGVLIAAVGSFLAVTLMSVNPDIFARFGFKFSAYINQRSEEFVMENIRVINEALDARPLTGVGLGGVWGVFGKHEVHSGYLGILTNLGYGGFLVYCWFLIEYLQALIKPISTHPQARIFGRIMIPLVLGMMLSWSYNYHFRKREFWATTAVAFSILAPLTAPHGMRLRKADAPQHGITATSPQ
jgi:hypothetical protein